MLRPFRPSFENLEKREVFSANPLTQMFGAELAVLDNNAATDDLSLSLVAGSASQTNLVATTFGRGVATGDINNDGRLDLLARSRALALDVTFDRDMAHTALQDGTLIEHDAIRFAAAHDAVFATLGRLVSEQDIWATNKLIDTSTGEVIWADEVTTSRSLVSGQDQETGEIIVL